MVDSHCHLDDPAFAADLDGVLLRAHEAGVGTMLSIDAPVAFLDRYPALLGTAGVHPHQAAQATDETIPELRARCGHPRIVGIGEIGLDYHYDFAPRPVQHRVFADQLRLAGDLGLPIVIHTREAWDDTFAILNEHWQGTGIMHCFSGSPKEAERCVEMGFYLAFGGVITFPKAAEIRDAAKWCPAERLLLETDCPYLAPVPMRGKRNEPALLAHTARALAALRETPLEELDRLTTANFRRLFALD